MDGSVRTALCASLGGMGPGTASPTSTTSPSPCSRCSSASPWKAGQTCYTGYVAGDGQRQGVRELKGLLPSTSPLFTSHDFYGEADECL